MDKFLCLHGHFYQPPRENPWTNEIDLQPSSKPYHDWNERITAECYQPLAELNIYERISYNFGPTLLSWMQDYAEETYQAILDADKTSMDRFNGHGSALAQCYNHMIMPLANERDKKTQVLWGIKDFEFHFKRKPEGMWLPETAVDINTLEVLADYEIKFTILSPKQALRIRKIGTEDWEELNKKHSIQTKRYYQCNLPSGKSINIFFYDAYMSSHLAFGGYSRNTKRFIHGIQMEMERVFDESRLIHAAVDGETYGHHQKKGHEILNSALIWADETEGIQLINYGDFLEKVPVQFEAEVVENTAWSCDAGLNRWNKDDRHSYDHKTRKVHKWRGVLRESLNWLRDELVQVYEKEMTQICDDPWRIRDSYIDHLLEGKEEVVISQLNDVGDKDKAFLLLELQKFTMFMFTSCGWFFEDIARIEAIQILRYAARAIEMAKEINGVELEIEFVNRLEIAQSKNKHLKNGKGVWEKHVKQLIV